MCVLQSGFMGSGTTQCEIIYGTDASYSNLPFMDTGSNTSTDIAVALTATLQARTTYYYIATATSGNVCARLQGSFTTGTVYLCIHYLWAWNSLMKTICYIAYAAQIVHMRNVIQTHNPLFAHVGISYTWVGNTSPHPPINMSHYLGNQIKRPL